MLLRNDFYNSRYNFYSDLCPDSSNTRGRGIASIARSPALSQGHSSLAKGGAIEDGDSQTNELRFLPIGGSILPRPVAIHNLLPNSLSSTQYQALFSSESIAAELSELRSM